MTTQPEKTIPNLEDFLKEIRRADVEDLRLMEEKVITAIKEQSYLSSDLADQEEKKRTFGERLSDAIADFGGSWKFILSFLGFLVLWIIANVMFLGSQPFDPFPFILLNLLLSCVAALQAPVIMMSQNRKESRDRIRAQSDYMINLKAEIEIRMLSEKLDYLSKKQMMDLLEVQRKQIEIFEALIKESKA